MRYSLVFLYVFLAIGGASPAAPSGISTDRYVSPAGNDNSDGSKAKPWKTLEHAAPEVRPGTTVHVAPGEYRESVITKISGLPQARIRFVSDEKWAARIRSVKTFATWTNHGDYVDIVGFDISGDGFGGILNWGSGVHIIANHVHHIPAPGCTGDGGSGINNANYQASDNDIVANVVNDIGDLTTICPRVHAIYHSNLRGHIVNNIAYRNQGFGIHLWHAATDVVIANNLVFNNHFGGILIGAGDAPHRNNPAFPADRISVINNIVVYNLNRYGIEELGVTGTHNRYINNLVYKNQGKNWKLLTGSQYRTIEADPEFINYEPDGTGDYHLRPSSPAIASGICADGPGRDIDGDPRSLNAACNLGPYESSASPSQPVWPAE